MSLYFHFKNLSDEELELFDAMILSGVVEDLQISDISVAIVKKMPDFQEFLNKNNITPVKILTEDFKIVEPDLKEVNIKNGWDLK